MNHAQRRYYEEIVHNWSKLKNPAKIEIAAEVALLEGRDRIDRVLTAEGVGDRFWSLKHAIFEILSNQHLFPSAWNFNRNLEAIAKAVLRQMGATI